MVILVIFFSFHVAVATVVFNDGEEHDIDYVIDDAVEIYDSFIGKTTTVNVLPTALIQWQVKTYDHSELNLFGGTIRNDLWFYDASNITIQGVNIKRQITADHNSRVTITGGTVGENISGGACISKGSSRIEISGGNFKSYDANRNPVFILYNNSLVTIRGNNFNLGYGTYTHADFPSGGNLIGTLSNGNPINIDFEIEDDAVLFLAIPEPATLSLILLGGIALAKRRKQRIT